MHFDSDATTLNRPTPKATRRDWVGLAVIALPCLLYSMDLTVLNLAVPHLAADLNPSATQLLWIVDIYGFVLAGALIPMGVFGDRIGRRRLLIIGAAVFGAASTFAAFSPSAAMLITARAVLGLAAATLAPSTLSLIRNMFLNPAQRTVAIGIWVASFSAGAAIGPLLGGVLLQHLWWGSVFLLNVPVMLLLLAVAPILLPEFRDPNPRRIDAASAVLSLMTVLAVIYGLKGLAVQGPSWTSCVSIAVGVLSGGLFLRRQPRLADPFIDVALFRRGIFSTAIAINLCGFFVAFGSSFLVAQYLQLVIGLSPGTAGIWSAPSGVAFITGSMLAPYVVRRFRPAWVMAGGFAIAAVGYGLLAQTGGAHDLALVTSAYFILSLGLAPVFTLSTDQIISLAPPERAGVASGIAETSTELGGALGIAVLGSFVTALYRGGMEPSLLGELPAGSATAVRDSLVGAAKVARDISGPTGAHLLELAREVFMNAFQGSALFCAMLTTVAAIATSAVLGVRRNSHSAATPPT